MLIFFLIKLGLSKKTPTAKASLARHIIGLMTGNANFATPSPTLASIGLAADVLDAAEAAMDGSAIKTDERNIAQAALVNKLNQLQGYVESIAGNNTSIILSAGMEVRSPRTVTGLLGPVTDLTYKLGLFPGSVDINWKGIKNSKLFIVEARLQNLPLMEWDFVGETTKSKITISGLQSNTTYEFRIACISSAGPGPYCDPFVIRAY